MIIDYIEKLNSGSQNIEEKMSPLKRRVHAHIFELIYRNIITYISP